MKTSKSITLNQWVKLHLLAPALVVSFVLTVGTVGFSSARWAENRQHLKSTVRESAQSLSLALMQKNLNLTELVLGTLRTQLSAKHASLCKNGQAIAFSSKGVPSCKGSLAVPIEGASEYMLVIEYSSWHEVSTLLFLIGMPLFFLGFQVWSYRRTKIRMLRDLIEPIEQGLSLDRPHRVKEMEELRLRLIRVSNLQAQSQVSEALIQRNEQIAHDLRSPLAALGIAVREATGIPTDMKNAARSSVERIREIAATLSLRPALTSVPANSTIDASLFATEQEEAVPVLIDLALEDIVAEKALKLSDHHGLRLCWVRSSEFALSATVSQREFGRVISNLIDNAAESINGAGEIRISTQLSSNRIIVTIEDTGSGIPPQVLARIGERGMTHGKTGGSGLGLYHAKKAIHSWGGNLNVAPRPGKGTCVSISLPSGQLPAWIAAPLILSSTSVLLILDDDLSIHEVWKTKIQRAFSAAEKTLPHVIYCRNLEEAVNGIRQVPDRFLIDYDLGSDSRTGPEIVREWGVEKQAILMTSQPIRENRFPILPKQLLADFPILVHDD